ncbi:chymotrypsin inhibitor Ani s 6-like isoform X1 [Cotesia glomerata]|uniref:TIL domain-containing protein n=1 Tax=Cotesia glomerata TaxID=32391 RepID=A0AAV7IGA3_COTGL|nr:chymotrypsin inhibitor Ani s 6-like isoform X1 [Cotesia glomerata]KAH0552138.1 hypothetical protein KQX54_006135 [Cotesia glomerata]
MKQILALSIFLSLLTFIKCYRCGPNEEYNICGRSCEPSCKMRDFSAALCAPCNKSTQGCRCLKNYYRDEENMQCVDAEHCSTCANGEKKLACGRKCEGTCAAPYEPEICARIKCGSLLCRCDLANNFVRSTDGSCVKKRDCHKY